MKSNRIAAFSVCRKRKPVTVLKEQRIFAAPDASTVIPFLSLFDPTHSFSVFWLVVIL